MTRQQPACPQPGTLDSPMTAAMTGRTENEGAAPSMTRIAVFPGQGAQAVGMGRALYDSSAAARAVFDEVDEALGEPLSTLIFEGSAERLTLTANAQPALMATSLAAVRAVEERIGRKLTDLVGYRRRAQPRRALGPGRGRCDLHRRRGAAAAPARAGHAGRRAGGRGRHGGDPGCGRADGRGGGRRGRGRGRGMRARQRQWRGPAGHLRHRGRRGARRGPGQGARGAAQRDAAGLRPLPLRADAAGGRPAGRGARTDCACRTGGAGDRQCHRRAGAGRRRSSASFWCGR